MVWLTISHNQAFLHPRHEKARLFRKAFAVTAYDQAFPVVSVASTRMTTSGTGFQNGGAENCVLVK